MRRQITRMCIATLGGAATLVLASPGAASAAPAESCWTWANEHTMSKLHVPLMDDTMTLKWCASSGRVTKFWVQSSEAVVRNSAWVSDARQDIRRQNEFGSADLHVVADFSVSPTLRKLTLGANASKGGLSAEAKAEIEPGRLNDLFDITLHADGRVTGTNWSG